MLASIEPHAAELQTQGWKQRLDLLPAGLRHAVLDFIDWLLHTTPTLDHPPEAFIDGVCTRLIGLGVPIDRYRTSTTMATADTDAFGGMWVRNGSVSVSSSLTSGGDELAHPRIPFHEVSATGRWVDLALQDVPDERFAIVSELKAAGYTHYLCAPMPMPVGVQGWLTVATKARGGFTRENVAVLALVVPVLGALINARIARMALDRLLRTYVGDEPHRAILNGDAKRGQVTAIRSAMLFADMRNSTGHTADLGIVEAAELMNVFFDCLVPPIEARGGEVLKYLGDGLLAIFRPRGENDREAAQAALAAAEAIFVNIAALNRTRGDRRPIEAGVALHYGQAGYGNVGSGLRLDFTVMGRDVAVASRIGDLNAPLGEPLLLSSTFADTLGGIRCEAVDTVALRGFKEPMVVFRPRQRP